MQPLPREIAASQHTPRWYAAQTPHPPSCVPINDQLLQQRCCLPRPRAGLLLHPPSPWCSLFSKWFSESGKLVSRLFARIQEAVEEEDSLVFVLIDEVGGSACAG